MSDTPSRPTQAQLDRYAEQFSQSAPMRHLGVRLSFPEGRKVVAAIPELQHHHRGGLGTASAINGAVLAGLFDLVLGCTPALLDPTKRCATLQLSMTFQRPATGNSLRAEAEIDSHGKSTLFASAKILDDQGNVCARAQGVVRLSTQTWSSGDSPSIG
ncbi:PaaI family thioesterase [Hyalangium minutum]|uniref:Thioesterase family protein n=1 Tax=Hyalangium minutum TaxID=394096 RepID=A0A085WJ79_9BACT|nr:PaaI family thioesterase [Hyalangium minutum]KFE67742.1 thioesterase family protein [Hyalangium minutum]